MLCVRRGFPFEESISSISRRFAAHTRRLRGDAFGENSSLESISDSTAREVVWRHLYADAVADQDAYAVLAHLAGDCGQHHVRAVVELHLEEGVGLLVDDYALRRNQVVFSQ